MHAQGNKPKIRVSITVENEALRKAQRRNALVTILGPLAGTLTAFAFAAYNGVSGLDITLLITTFVLINFGLEVGFHRYFAHRAFSTSRFMTVTMAILGSMAAEGSVLYWAAGHRRHHAHSDTEDDPHSPHMRYIDKDHSERMSILRGLWHSHIGWMMSDRVTNCTLFAKDILRDPILNKIHQLYVPIVLAGLLIPGLIGGLVTMSWTGALSAFLWGGMVRMFLLHHSTWSNASFAHIFGTRPFQSGDQSANNLWCAIPTFGAAWQNNHHMFPTSAYLGLEWWQIDVGGMIISLMQTVGIIWEVKGPPAREVMAAKRAAA